MKHTKFVAALCTLMTAFGCATTSPSESLVFSEYEAQNRIALIQRTALVASNPPQTQMSIETQAAATAGREDLNAALQNEYSLRAHFECTSANSVPVIEQVAELARTHSLIIINEHHAKPGHRVFIRSLAERLSAEGFTHFAAEAFLPTIATGEGYPNSNEGYYTTEPMMARMVEQLRTLGYTLVAYEAQPGQFDPFDEDVQRQIDQREEAQADNLIDAVLAHNPDTKMIVQVGHGHVVEFPPEGLMPWMAARLKAKSGIDPLTITLTLCESDGAKAVMTPGIVKDDGSFKAKPTDYAIGLPVLEFVRGRPKYRLDLGDQLIEVPQSLRPSISPVLIEARAVGASLDQQPIERLFLMPGEHIPLALPLGAWSLISIDQAGVVTGQVSVTVD
ncbi:MAG: hypothetical protein AAF331_15120 [Pseudomonadota bacterium]